MPVLLQIAIGGALGATLRYLSTNMALRLLGPGFPWGTLFVNVIGSFLMGIVAAIIISRGHPALSPWYPLLITGILGGFTTFSAFSLDVVLMAEKGHMAQAAGYILASVILSIGALAVGWILFRAGAS